VSQRQVLHRLSLLSALISQGKVSAGRDVIQLDGSDYLNHLYSAVAVSAVHFHVFNMTVAFEHF
jgi:hypothetical protein